MNQNILIIIFILVIILILITSQQITVAVLTGIVAALCVYIVKSHTEENMSDGAQKVIVDTDINLESEADLANKNSIGEQREYDHSEIIDELFKVPTVEDGDEQIYNYKKQLAAKAKEAILYNLQSSANTSKKYFQEELDEQEKRHWYENDMLDPQ